MKASEGLSFSQILRASKNSCKIVIKIVLWLKMGKIYDL